MRKFLRGIYWITMGFVLTHSWWVYAEEVALKIASHSEKNSYNNSDFYALAAGLAIAIAAFGGALGQGRVGAAAMEGIARNPQSQKIMFIPMIIVLALIESFVIFSFAIAMIIAGKI